MNSSLDAETAQSVILHTFWFGYCE